MDDEQLKAELDSKRKPGAVLERLGTNPKLASVFAAEDRARAIGSIIEQAHEHPQLFSRFQVLSQHRAEIGPAFAAMSDADIHDVIETLLPRIAPSVESAWHALVRRPYQEGTARRSFRAPHSPKTLAGMRGRWLLHIAAVLGEYDADITWVAEYGAALSGWSSGSEIGWLLAGAIDQGGETGDAVFAMLRAIALGEQSNAQMGRHVTQALMSCNRPEAWELVERLLLAAQRQEGLRQTILEAVDESHPQAFRRMLRLIRDENLTRFSSVVRATDTWFAFMWDGASSVKVDSIIERVLTYLDDEQARTAALGGNDVESTYLALWSIAFDDVDAAIEPATALLSSSSVAARFVATHFLAQTIWTSAFPRVMEMLADRDLSVAGRALDLFGTDMTKHVDGVRLFDLLEGLMRRVPKRTQNVVSPVWPWCTRKFEKSRIAASMIAHSSVVGTERLLPWVPELGTHERASYVRLLSGVPSQWQRELATVRKTEFTTSERAILLELMGDASGDVRSAVFDAFRDLPLLPDEIDRSFELLDRKVGDLRNRCLTRLRSLPDAELRVVAHRLIEDQSGARQTAGRELLQNVSAGPEHESTDDALGLLDPAALRKWPDPRQRDVEVVTTGAAASLSALAELILKHQNTEVRVASGETKMLLETSKWALGTRKLNAVDEKPAVPLGEVWRSWAEQRPTTVRDPDGLELVRLLIVRHDHELWSAPPVHELRGLGQYRAGERFLSGILEWCAVWDAPSGATTFLIDGFENALASLTNDDFDVLREHARTERSELSFIVFGGVDKHKALRERIGAARAWLSRVRWWTQLFPSSLTPDVVDRVYGLLRWAERRSSGASGIFVSLDDFITAYKLGIANEAELTDLLAGSTASRSRRLREASTRKLPKSLGEHPELLAVVDKCRRRIVEVESKRGDQESAASKLTLELRATGGLETLALALPSLGKTHFARHFSWFNSVESRQETLSHLVLRSIPRDGDTRDAFAAWTKQAKISEAKLVELAVYAPQWASHVNHVLAWPGLESAVWWIQAHTKDDRSWQLNELKEIWAAEVSERTPLSADDLTEGAVDVAWFREAHSTLGAERWATLDAAAKYAASSAGHTRAQLFARAMSGVTSAAEILDRLRSARHQDSARALGLVPLSAGDGGRRELLERYTALQDYHREARQFGSQRQQSERRAAAIGLANLARTAGFRDPQRLQWAMEQEAVADLARGPVVLEREGVTFTLAIDADGTASLDVSKNGKPLKTTPASLKKDAEVEEMKERLQELKRQRSRVRDALEEAMCRGDTFTMPELRALFEHPGLAPSIAKLVFVGDGIAGYPIEGGRALRDHAGASQALGNDEHVRIAHAHDLFKGGHWSAWQRECLAAARVQPFKQLFRELYPLTTSERHQLGSKRYAGHQVNPRQALALLGGRGWVARPEEGVSRTFHDEGLTARLSFQETFITPAEIEGLTLEDVMFTKKGEWTALELDDIPPRVFSEAMRDLDLVVSVAHRGGVDPEATTSTVEMRGALVRETASLLSIRNVEVLSNHVIVKGTLGRYSVHLGSANVLLMPGTSIPIVAVHSQHRGRLFLPFADDDPRTAEVLSKVLLLARDQEIRDPNILEWIRATKAGPAA